jgi:hypothetical protein
MEAVEAGEPVSAIVEARKPRRRGEAKMKALHVADAGRGATVSAALSMAPAAVGIRGWMTRAPRGPSEACRCRRDLHGDFPITPDGDPARGSYVWGMAREIFFPPEDPEAAVRFWRARATKLEAEVAELKAALARKEAYEAGKPVPSIVRARKPKPRW